MTYPAFSNKQRTMALAGLGLLAMAATTPARADVRSDIEARYAALKVAMDTREPGQIKPLLTPDFESVDISGEKEDADAMVGELAMVPVDPDRQSTTAIQSLTLDGDVAQVAQQHQVAGQRAGRDGTMHTFRFTTLSHDTWVRSGETWLLKRTETDDMTFERDGQVVRHLKQGDAIPARGKGPGGGGRRGGRAGPPPGDGGMGPPSGGEPMGPPPPDAGDGDGD